MPPKKDKKTKKKKEVKIDGIDIHTMSQEQVMRSNHLCALLLILFLV